ncbi:MAG TPA: GAF domain-containing protein [Planctomycetota bacterium]|nr:GAF domain-containing protein [Planctomycetota bacterium]
MTERSTDALEMLLPEAAPLFWQRAQKVTTFLRLLSDDARGHAGQSVGVSLARARGVFERSSLERCVRVHEELLRHQLYALVGCDSFAHFGECEGELQSAWSELEELRGESPWVAHVPAPGESAASVAARLLAGLERSGASAARVELWNARRERAASGIAAGENAFAQCLRSPASTAAQRSEPQLELAGAAGLVECLLDRAAVRQARARLEALGSRALGDTRLRRLCIWTRALLGDDEGARVVLGNLSFARSRLPRPLAELRARAPSKAAWFAGQPGTSESLLSCELEASEDIAQDAAGLRSRLGAALFSAWRLEAPGHARLVAHALAPAHRGRLADWIASREGACADPRECESQLLSDARLRVVHFGADSGSETSRASIDPASIQAMALVPVLDMRGDLCGWLNLEFEHHLVASAAQLAQAARAWVPHLAPMSQVRLETVPSRLEDESSSAASVLRSFVDGLALKTTQRRWSAFDVRDSGLVLVAQGGGALESAEENSDAQENPLRASSESVRHRGQGRAVARAAATGRPVLFSEADSNLGLHPDAASGVAVPLQLRGRVAGVWLVESTRRRDFSAADLRRFETRASALAAELAAAQFRSWHRARFGHDVCVQAAASSAGLSPEQLVALATSRAPVALSGPIGSGRRMLARRLHFESSLRGAALVRVQADVAALERELAASDEPRGLIVERALELAQGDQSRLAQLIEERADSRSRVCLLLDRSLDEAREQGAIAPELAWFFSRVELKLAPLAQRRTEIVPLALLFAAHFATEEGVRTPELDDEALALLWRQAWSGNVRELAQWMYRLVLCHPAGLIDAAALERLAARFGQTLVARMPSRHPDRELLCAALETTANRKGTWNKTRAALYLGWDTDTLQSRLVEAGLGNASSGAGAAESSSRARGADDPPAV